jgi:hypothetical protein
MAPGLTPKPAAMSLPGKSLSAKQRILGTAVTGARAAFPATPACISLHLFSNFLL